MDGAELLEHLGVRQGRALRVGQVRIQLRNQAVILVLVIVDHAAGRPAAEEVRVEGEPLDRDKTVQMDARDLQDDEPTRETRRDSRGDDQSDR